ncbi:MAG: type II restriction endonuclease [Acidaminococcaceae bacterium]
MKYLAKYKSMGMLSEKAVFEYLLDHLKETIRTYDFFVAWEKIIDNVSCIEVSLNILNTLIGKENVAQKLKALIKQYPEVVPVIPLLIAVRGKSIKVANFGGNIEYSFVKKKEYTDAEIEKIVCFAEKCGLLKVIADKNIKNLVDYAVGVEVGLDTNARKNRSGTAMENLIEAYIKAICSKHNFRYLAQATADKIKHEFGKEVSTDKVDRHFDFAIDTGDKLFLVEVNYYSGGGSKLKAVAGEFSSLFSLVKNENINFIWITDGKGWLTAERPLLETFNAIDFIMNIKMIDEGLLEEIVTKGL